MFGNSYFGPRYFGNRYYGQGAAAVPAPVVAGGPMSFLAAVNRMLRINGFIRGDTDLLASFSDTAHNSTSQVAQIAVQQEITELSSRGLLARQITREAILTLFANTRTYALPANFLSIWGDPPFIYDPVQNNVIFQYPGGENVLRRTILNYRTSYGYPQCWYFDEGSTQRISFFNVPDSSLDGRTLLYDYDASVNVLVETDPMPVPTTDQAYALVDMCARRFKFLYEGKVDQPIDSDPVYRDARTRLFSLMKMKRPPSVYGSVYVSGTLN